MTGERDRESWRIPVFREKIRVLDEHLRTEGERGARTGSDACAHESRTRNYP